MKTSEQINELAAALAKAQGSGDRFQESAAIVPLARATKEIRRGNGLDGRTTLQRFLEKLVFGVSECWFWRGALHKLGYGLMNAIGESKAHRVAYRLFVGQIPEGLDVLHKCDVRNCVNPDHLFVGTHAENMADMVSKGRSQNRPQYGEENPRSKLTADQVEEMRRIRAETGMPYHKLAAMFGVVTMTAQRACVGTSWSKPQ